MMALLANCHRDPRRHGPFEVSDFHPLPDERQAARPAKVVLPVTVLKGLFKRG